jgi:predicted TIM-barrel fold metal-dependent hydrolase
MSAANDNHPVEEVRMKTEDLILISVDDHICEPADMFEAHVPQKYRQYMPRVETDPSGGQQWWYGEVMGRNLGLAASAGKPPELRHINPCRYEEMRPGCYQVSERVRDMDAGGQLAGLNFPNWTGFAGQVLNQGPDSVINEVMIMAYNDWHIDEWCAYAPDRFIPCGIVPLFDPNIGAREVRRLASKGCHAITFTENWEGLPRPSHSIHSRHWDPIWKACLDSGTVVCCHLGTSPRSFTLADGDPVSLMSSVYFPLMSVCTFGDLIWADIWDRFPGLKFSISEGDIGWMPYFLQKAEHVQQTHSGWTKKVFPDGGSPTSVFRDHILCCFIDDPIGVELIDKFNVSNVMWEGDFPHADTSWPYGPETAMKNLGSLSYELIQMITHENAIRHFQFDPFRGRPRSECTVGALRSRATDVDVVTHVGRRISDDEDKRFRETAKSAAFLTADDPADGGAA